MTASPTQFGARTIIFMLLEVSGFPAKLRAISGESNETFERFEKIITNNGLDFEHLVFQVEKETRDVKRFSEKIDITALMKFQECEMDEEEKLYQLRVIEFLADLKKRYS